MAVRDAGRNAIRTQGWAHPPTMTVGVPSVWVGVSVFVGDVVVGLVEVGTVPVGTVPVGTVPVGTVGIVGPVGGGRGGMRTSIPNVPWTSTPALLRAEQVTSVSPSGKVVPEGGSQVTGSGPSTALRALTAGYSTASPFGLLVVKPRSGGTVMTGVS